MPEDVSPPTPSQVAEKLKQLASGEISREEASVWASRWITRFDEFQVGNTETDRKIKRALDELSMADSPTSDRRYLFEQIDFEGWLREFLL